MNNLSTCKQVSLSHGAGEKKNHLKKSLELPSGENAKFPTNEDRQLAKGYKHKTWLKFNMIRFSSLFLRAIILRLDSSQGDLFHIKVK